uniref:Protein kinase domain-containing protein n=1 Tax=Chromera velia CCMP2878 TaxID=1169474 RepID=A0A0G4HPR7_9ALVE|eukprot:Cvel_30034.t1-p1 / transcript=Cvel_30034.t1 / gene=Cvel_30034 / organism=Chromera_velia_CCMP2878 / gene_product=Probable serine/threonine-protein kinase, putative / transcript_product=Probable serine/threonine-protein kinase, putative / location=Cvel_scaffold4220:6321-6611(-) / protein_length=97 / sequence_SO=supercontig / SO=protein_coding / is_pseudo=false
MVCGIHRKGVTHRDLKLSNVLFKNMKAMNGMCLFDILVTDFRQSIWGTFDLYAETGTHVYKSPEIYGGTAYTSTTDSVWWSVGAIVFYVATGYPPTP